MLSSVICKYCCPLLCPELLSWSTQGMAFLLSWTYWTWFSIHLHQVYTVDTPLISMALLLINTSVRGESALLFLSLIPKHGPLCKKPDLCAKRIREEDNGSSRQRISWQMSFFLVRQVLQWCSLCGEMERRLIRKCHLTSSDLPLSHSLAEGVHYQFMGQHCWERVFYKNHCQRICCWILTAVLFFCYNTDNITGIDKAHQLENREKKSFSTFTASLQQPPLEWWNPVKIAVRYAVQESDYGGIFLPKFLPKIKSTTHNPREAGYFC